MPMYIELVISQKDDPVLNQPISWDVTFVLFAISQWLIGGLGWWLDS